MRERTFNRLVIVLIAIAILGADLLYHHIVYTDWTCAFARCVKVKNVRP